MQGAGPRESKGHISAPPRVHGAHLPVPGTPNFVIVIVMGRLHLNARMRVRERIGPLRQLNTKDPSLFTLDRPCENATWPRLTTSVTALDEFTALPSAPAPFTVTAASLETSGFGPLLLLFLPTFCSLEPAREKIWMLLDPRAQEAHKIRASVCHNVVTFSIHKVKNHLKIAVPVGNREA